jgi:transcription-repair coupling factor (superfamily II helicase)
MPCAALVRHLTKSQLIAEWLEKLKIQRSLRLHGLSRLPKAIVAAALAKEAQGSLATIVPTQEEAGRWALLLANCGWEGVQFYPTTEALPYGNNPTDEETVWGQMQVLADCVAGKGKVAIVATERALQPHLPAPEAFLAACLSLQKGDSRGLDAIGEGLTQLGYDRVSLVEVEGQWSRRGDIVDVFPVAASMPVRMEWFDDELEKLREFDVGSQRSLDEVDRVFLTPTDFGKIEGEFICCLADYWPQDCLLVWDELSRSMSHSQRWFELAEERFLGLVEKPENVLHRDFTDIVEEIKDRFLTVDLYELPPNEPSLEVFCKGIPTLAHQFGKVADVLRDYQRQGYSSWSISAQPSRTVSLLQEHDCSAQFVPNPRDYPAIDKLQIQHLTIALKVTGLAELEGFISPSLRMVVYTDRELYGQQALSSFSFVRKRRAAVSKQLDLQKLRPGDYVVHKEHGIGRFMKMEQVEIDRATREYLTIKYADGVLKVQADRLGMLSRFRHTADNPPELHKLTTKTWEKTKARVKKSVKKLAVDLLKIYADRTEKKGFTFPEDSPWQQELEDSFAYEPTPDQLKATQDVKRDMESDRPMDRLVCGDVGYGKTEVAIRAIFKAVTTANKQVALLAPTTILSQQHYHTLKERFAPYPINIGLLNRFRSNEEKKQVCQRLATGELDIVVGTHQLLSKEINFQNLGLLVIDEEQRFGVNQKEKIKSFKRQIDVLTLSATPIPRTLYMSLSGVREMSLISTPPPSRRAIQTHLSPHNYDTIATAIRQELDRGGQIFFVVSRIEGIEGKAAKIQELVPSCRIAIGHGQMDEASLEATMLAFGNGEADLLVCTTIVESGLDIPRVNTILIEDAHRFGLAQLYQLRGRVGRSGIQANAWLFYPPVEKLSDAARQRLRAIKEFSFLGSGYHLATRDMEIRGVGSLLGAEQSGQIDTIGFDLYMEMLQEAIHEIRGEEIPEIEDTQIDLRVTAFIPADYIPDADSKMAAYRAIAAATTAELPLIATEWIDRYGTIPKATLPLFKVVELKQIAKRLGFSRIRHEGEQNIVLETPMAEPAWRTIFNRLPTNLRDRSTYTSGKVTLRNMGSYTISDILDILIQGLEKALVDR